MATRENQGLQIALMIFVAITVLLAISTFYFFRQIEESQNALAAAQQRERDADARVDTVVTENGTLKTFLGFEETTPLAEIQAQYEADMTMFPAGYDKEKNYRQLPAELMQALKQRQGQVADLSVETKKLDADKEAVEAREIAKTEEALEGLQTTQTDLAAERTKFNDALAQHQAKQQEFRTAVDNYGKERTTMIAKHDQEIAAIKNDLNQEADRANALATKVASLTKTTFETADGQITWVNQKSETCWIDVGLLDGLRPQTSFKVYPPGQNSYEVEASKGTIEVVAILDKHRAEARIVSDSTTDPILPGDFIYTPLWRPGTQVRFALAGKIDLDDDGQSDRSLIKSLITMNSGIIDAEVDEEGKRSGRMTVDTRYLVVGKRPTETTDPAAIAGYTNMLTDAQNLGIEQITVDKLLDFLNYRGTERSVRLGRGANPKDFRAEPPEGVNRSSTGNNAFQQRRPPAASGKGAY